MSDESTDPHGMPRRLFLRAGAVGAAAVAMEAGRSYVLPTLADRGFFTPDGLLDAASVAWADAIYTEVFPTSPLILHPFTDPLPVLKAAKPVVDPATLTPPPGPGKDQQNGGPNLPGVPNGSGNETHQLWPSNIPTNLGGPYPDPIVYYFKVKIGTHSFTSSEVLPIDSAGRPTKSFDSTGTVYPAGTVRTLPKSTIYGFADASIDDKAPATFPGPMINAEYGKPALVRFENHLDENPDNLDRQDFGTPGPDYTFLTHLHNGHTAPESDGNPHYSMTAGPKFQGYQLGQFVDNLYLNWPAGNDEREKQSFFWFHDHRMDHTGSNVYKGMVGLYPIYDPVLDPGDETNKISKTGLKLPGVRTDNGDRTFDVDFDIPLAIYDCRLDDGVTVHHDFHDREFPEALNKAHPEWWGKTFFRHFPNHGFVGDIFTVNGVAYPVLHVKRRRYRLRFLDASIARIYEFKLMSSTTKPQAARDLGLTGGDLQGQWRLPNGQQCMKWTQIAADGGLLEFPITRDSFELWPAKRREFVVDFRYYMDGVSRTKDKEVIYLTNVMKMPDGRMWSNSSRFSPDPNYKVPMLAFVIDGNEDAPDDSVMPVPLGKPNPTKLRDLPPIPPKNQWQNLLDNRLIFEVKRGSAGGEIEWLINGVPFDPNKVATSLTNRAGRTPQALPKKNSFNFWEIRNGGGGWVHPFHLHMEEHRTIMRNGKDVTDKPDPGHPDDRSREDLAALDPGESVILYRGFRDFTGPYVAHCHNLAHEDHAMMFGWRITP